ncbi:MAG: hypothetical protein GQ475_01915 [Methylococcaceae bacterium]|nr:hypothetical protein [Methylococcaceae bacterium]
MSTLKRMKKEVSNNLFIYLIVALFVSMNVLSQCFFKLGIPRINSISELHALHSGVLFILAGCLVQMVSIGSWLLMLKYKDLAWAGMMASLIPISLMLTGKYLFKENVDSIMMLGAAIVFLGLLVVNHSAFSYK